jgi:chitodextrinase
VSSVRTGVGVFLLFGALLAGSGICSIPPLEPAYEIGLNDYVSQIRQRVAENSQILREGGLLPAASGQAVTFGFPIFTPDLTDFGDWCILYFVDQDSADYATLDWNCGTRTYDGHCGTDFFLWPFGWYKMDLGEAKVVAAASGVIVDKQDGNFDRCCDGNCGEGNYVVLEHEDGTKTIYYHVRSGSVTAKSIGQSVQKGEVVALVGSSGVSGGPHLHFEVWDSTGAVVDPYGGPCNHMNSESRWDIAQSYYQPSVLALTVHASWPEYSPCPTPATPNTTDLYHSGGSIVFGCYERDLMPGDTTYETVRRPDSTVQWSWSWAAPETYQISGGYMTGTYYLPADAPSGEWTFEATLRESTYTHFFYVQPGDDPITVRIYLKSETAKIDFGAPSMSCSNSEEEMLQHVDGSGAVDYQRAAIFSADMNQIPEGAVLDNVATYLWARTVAGTMGGQFKVYVATGDNDTVACSACMNWSEAYVGCGIDGANHSLVFSDSSATVGGYADVNMATLFTDDGAILDRASQAHSNFDQHNHHLYFECVMLAPNGATDTYADGYMYGEAAEENYRPYVDVRYFPLEYSPPVPDPLDWAAEPYAPVGSTTSIRISAFQASDGTPPVEYYFECTGGSGGGDRTWDASRDYVDTGLSPNTQYSYRIKARDSAVSPNEGAFSEPSSAFTRAARPPAPIPGGATFNSIALDLSCGLNPAYTELALWNETEGYWVASDGGNGGSAPAWATDAAWGTVTVTGLTYLTNYCFSVQARNGDGATSTMSPLTCVDTQDCASVDSTDGGDGGKLEFSVSAATPNPAPGIIQIRFTLPEAQRVRVRVFDVAGRVAGHLLDERLPAGRHQIAWRATGPDGHKVQPGLYFLRLEAASGEATRKVIVLD